MLSPVEVSEGEPVPFPYVVRARYEFQIDGVIAGAVLRALAPVAPRETTSQVAALAVDVVEAGRVGAVSLTEDRRLISLDALSEWDAPVPTTTWARLHDVVARSLALIDSAGSDKLRGTLADPLRRLAAA